MEEQFDLRSMAALDSMHDQRIHAIELKSKTLTFHYSDLCFDEPHCEKARVYYDKHKMFTLCDVVFLGVESADVFAEVKQTNEFIINGTVYYGVSFLEYINKNRYCVETTNFYYGYRTVIIDASLVNESGYYCEDCTIKITADEVVYYWS